MNPMKMEVAAMKKSPNHRRPVYEIRLSSGFVTGIVLGKVNECIDNLARALIGEIGIPAVRKGKSNREARYRVIKEAIRICLRLDDSACRKTLVGLLVQRHDAEMDRVVNEARGAIAAMN
jgi:hypothetical protein